MTTFAVSSCPISPKVTIRDVLYDRNIIFEDVFAAVAKSRAMTRLHDIRQLSVAHYVLSHCTHTRYEHSIGVYHLATELAPRLFPQFEDLQKDLRLAALLHDVGHGPFSHLFDDAIMGAIYPDQEGHDTHRVTIITQEEELQKIWKHYHYDPMRIVALWQAPMLKNVDDDNNRSDSSAPVPTSALTMARWLLEQWLDRMDYIVRDSGAWGQTTCWRLTVQRILQDLRFHYSPERGYFATLPFSVLHDFRDWLNQRGKLFINLYHHPTVLVYSALIGRILKAAAKHTPLVVESVRDLKKFMNLTDGILNTLRAMPINTTHSELVDAIAAFDRFLADPTAAHVYGQANCFVGYGATIVDPSVFPNVISEYIQAMTKNGSSMQLGDAIVERVDMATVHTLPWHQYAPYLHIVYRPHHAMTLYFASPPNTLSSSLSSLSTSNLSNSQQAQTCSPMTSYGTQISLLDGSRLLVVPLLQAVCTVLDGNPYVVADDDEGPATDDSIVATNNRNDHQQDIKSMRDENKEEGEHDFVNISDNVSLSHHHVAGVSTLFSEPTSLRRNVTASQSANIPSRRRTHFTPHNPIFKKCILIRSVLL